MRRSLSIGGLVLLQLLTTIATQLIIIRVVGIGSETDAYIAAQTAPSILAAIIVTALQSVWLPRLSIMNDDLSAWRNEQSIAQGQGLLLGAGVILLIYLLLPIVAPLVFPGFNEEQIHRVLLFSYPLLLSVIFNIQTALLTVALRARDRFIVAELIAMVASIVALIAVVALLPQYGLEAVVLINLMRSISIYLIQMYFAKWPLPSLIKGWQCKATWKMMSPLLFGASLFKTSPLVDRYWLSQASSGGVTVYSLAQTIMSMMSTILERVISMPLIPSFSRYVEAENYKELKKTYYRSLYKVTLVVIMIAFLLVLLKPIFIIMLSEILKLEQSAAGNIWLVCVLLLGYLHVAVSGAISVAVFYAFGDSRTPVIIGLCGFLLGFLLKWLWFVSNGINGIAIATSVYFMVNVALFFWKIDQKFTNDRN